MAPYTAANEWIRDSEKKTMNSFSYSNNDDNNLIAHEVVTVHSYNILLSACMLLWLFID